MYEFVGGTDEYIALRRHMLNLGAKAIVVAQNVTANLLLWALRERVLDVLPLPLQTGDLNTAVLRYLNDARRPAGNAARDSARVPALPASQVAAPKLSTLAAIEYIEQNYKYEIDVETAAALCGLSRSHFSRSFAKEHGVGFCEFVVQHRIAVARQLLKRPGISVAEVAQLVGFSDHSYFSKIFKRFVSMRPSDCQDG